MSRFEDDDNPYRSPTAPSDGRLRERTLRPGARARLLAKGLLYRRIWIEAPIEAELEFNGRSYWRDVIRVDGQIVASKISWWRITPHFHFDLPAGEKLLPVDVRIRLGPFLIMRGFQVAIGDQIVYHEGRM